MSMIERGAHLRQKEYSQQTLLTGVRDETLKRPSMPVVGFTTPTPGGRVTPQEKQHQERDPKTTTWINQAGRLEFREKTLAHGQGKANILTDTDMPGTKRVTLT